MASRRSHRPAGVPAGDTVGHSVGDTARCPASDPASRPAGVAAERPVAVLQITDTHLFASVDTTQRGVNTQASLDAVLDRARADPRWPPDAIVVTGDIVHDESRDGYLRFRKTLETLGPPAFCVPGNHDDPVALAECLSAPRVQVCGDTQLGTWRAILLSTFGGGEVAGALGSAELARMEATLDEYPGEHTLICMHHPPVLMGSAWLDNPGLRESEAFMELVRRHAQVRAVLWGHVHQESDRSIGGVRFMSCPSTCSQFQPGSDEFVADNLPPGMRWLDLQPDGSLTTEIVRISSWR